jgi:hypothetical protein
VRARAFYRNKEISIHMGAGKVINSLLPFINLAIRKAV